MAQRRTLTDIVADGLYIAHRDEVCFATWTPDLSAVGQGKPDWTKLIVGDYVLCNSVERASWEEIPAQLLVCEATGRVDATPGGYVEISRLGDHLVWTDPLFGLASEEERSRHGSLRAIHRHGAIAFTVDDWRFWHERLAALPEVERFPAMTRRQLAAAWIGTIHGFPPVTNIDALSTMLENVLLPRDVNSAVVPADLLQSLATWVAVDPDKAVDGVFTRADAAGAIVLPAYFESTGNPPWLGLARIGGHPTFAFGPSYVLVPAP